MQLGESSRWHASQADDDFARVAGFQCDRHLVGQYPAAVDIDDGGKVREPSGHVDVGRVQRPDLADGHVAQQVGVDPVLGGARWRLAVDIVVPDLFKWERRRCAGLSR